MQTNRSEGFSPRLYRSREGWARVMGAYDAALGRLTTPFETATVSTRFGPTHVILAGPQESRPAVLLHGWNANASGWWPQINAWAPHCRLVAPDTIGQAGKSAPTRPSTRGPAYADWLADTLDALDVNQAIFIGSSGGAWLTLKLAAYHPGRLSRAVLLSPAGIAPVRLRFALRVLAAGHIGPLSEAPRRQARLFSPPPLVIDEEHLGWQTPLVLHYRDLLPPPILTDETLRALTVPTLLLVGAHEAAFNRQAVLRRARRLVPHLTSEVLPEAGHDMTYDNPQAVNARVLRFLNETDPATDTNG